MFDSQVELLKIQRNKPYKRFENFCFFLKKNQLILSNQPYFRFLT
ncbi:unnamed protein product [Paramecium primaurelia]|uniref:Uncharacterized protein n=1 Tax=Paramecium primaurelia TaxID=5886 RepID=A0A8S1L0W3_PARPR|nr:unnamed protein product [Paramecium primaurelia]